MVDKETHARDLTDRLEEKNSQRRGSPNISWQKEYGVFKAAQKSEFTGGCKGLGQSMFKAL